MKQLTRNPDRNLETFGGLELTQTFNLAAGVSRRCLTGPMPTTDSRMHWDLGLGTRGAEWFPLRSYCTRKLRNSTHHTQIRNSIKNWTLTREREREKGLLGPMGFVRHRFDRCQPYSLEPNSLSRTLDRCTRFFREFGCSSLLVRLCMLSRVDMVFSPRGTHRGVLTTRILQYCLGCMFNLPVKTKAMPEDA